MRRKSLAGRKKVPNFAPVNITSTAAFSGVTADFSSGKGDADKLNKTSTFAPY